MADEPELRMQIKSGPDRLYSHVVYVFRMFWGDPTDFARLSLIFYLMEMLASSGMTPTDFIVSDHE